MAYQYKLEYGGQEVTLDSDEELTDEEIQEAADSAFDGVEESTPKKAPGFVDMVAPGLTRDQTPQEQERAADRAKRVAGKPYDPYSTFTEADPRLGEGAMNAMNTGARTIGAAIPTEFTRGKNEDGSMKSFTEAMADPNTGPLRGIREKYEQRLGENLAAIKAESNPFKKILHGIGAGLDGIGLLAASALEPGGAGIAKAFGRASKSALTLGKSTAKNMANTYIKEVGVPESALRRLADDPEAIKQGSLMDPEEWRTAISERIQGKKQIELDALSKDERKVMEGFQERLEEILDKKVTASAEAKDALDSKLFQLDQEVRDFADNIKATKASQASALSLEKSAQESNIAANALEKKNEVAAGAPDELLAGSPRLDAPKSGDEIQAALQRGETGLSDRYGELKDESFGFKKVAGSVLPGKTNVLNDAWSKVKNRVIQRDQARNAIPENVEAAFMRVIEDAGTKEGPLTLGELVNARKHIGRAIYGKAATKEQNELFRSVDRALKEDFYSEVNNEIGNQLGALYRKSGLAPQAADDLVKNWHSFNAEYSGIRKGLETLKEGMHYKATGGATDRYPSALGRMGIGDLKKAKSATLSAEATRPVWETLKDAYLNGLIDKASPGGVFSPKKFGKDWAEMVANDRERVVTILGEDKVREIGAYYKKMGESLDEIEAVATGNVDALAKALSEKSAAMAQKTGKAANAVKDYRKLQTSAYRGETAAQKAAIARDARTARGQAKATRDASVEALDARKADIEAMGKITLSGTDKNLHTAMTQTHMTGPERKKLMEKLTELYGEEEAMKIQDSYFAKAIGAQGGSIPLLTRMPTGRALLMGFISGHPLAAALATSPQVAAKAMRYGTGPATRLGAAIDKIAESPKLVNMFKMLNGIKKVEQRNRMLLQIMRTMEAEGIDWPAEEEPTVAPAAE